jgi:hypothetical protein
MVTRRDGGGVTGEGGGAGGDAAGERETRTRRRRGVAGAAVAMHRRAGVDDQVAWGLGSGQGGAGGGVVETAAEAAVMTEAH